MHALFILLMGISLLKATDAEPLKLNPILLSAPEKAAIGQKIWHNECKGSETDLTFWKEHEQWASVGIGHWIWHPANAKQCYQETIQELFAFLAQQGKPLPAGILANNATACPWNSREQFLRELESPKMITLRAYLKDTIPLQTEFIIKRLSASLEKILDDIKAPEDKKNIIQKVNALTQTPQGLYALIDYLNFKGEGLGPMNYQGHKWGLLQVLHAMNSAENNSLKSFATAAKLILNERIAHCPAERKIAEEGWRKGWFIRIDSYCTA